MRRDGEEGKKKGMRKEGANRGQEPDGGKRGMRLGRCCEGTFGRKEGKRGEIGLELGGDVC